MHCFGFIAHFDLIGFWTEYFTSNAGKIEFLRETLAWPCYGSPDHTWSDVERAIIERLHRADLLNIYEQRLCAEQDTTDRAELARLLQKYGRDAQPVDPGILRAVLIPVNRPTPVKAPRRDAREQLALRLG